MAVNFNDTTPAAPGGGINVAWQTDTSDNISAYVPAAAAGVPSSRTIATTLPLTGGGDLTANRTLAINDFTGDSGAGGLKGAVPAPVTGDAAAGKFLKASGGWAVPAGGAGTVTSVDASMGVATVSGSPITATGTIIGSQTVNKQTGTTYTVDDGDRGSLITFSNAGTKAITLPQASAGGFFLSGWFAYFENTGAGTATITPTTSTIDGAASLTLLVDQGVAIFTDGTNYFTFRGRPSAGGGTVTSVAASFTGGLVSVGGSPVTTTGTLALTVAGTSGGVPYFSSSSAWASSAALTANLPVIGGGAGAAPSVGSRSGNTTVFVTTTGSQTANNIVTIDANGNHIAGGLAAADRLVAFVGKPGAAAIVYYEKMARAIDWAANLASSVGAVKTNPTSTAAFDITKNGTTIATASISTSGVFTFTTTSGTAKSFAVGDILEVTAPGSQDATLDTITMTLFGTR